MMGEFKNSSAERRIQTYAETTLGHSKFGNSECIHLFATGVSHAMLSIFPAIESLKALTIVVASNKGQNH
jgi:hypothetical protein